MRYFQHDTDARKNRKLWKLIKTHGMVGYGIWWAVLEELYQAEANSFQINADNLWLERFADELKLTDERVLIRVFDTLAELHLIDVQLWHEHVLFVPAAIERGDAYVQRKSKTKERVRKHREERKQLAEQMKRVTNALQPECNALVPKYAEAEAEAEAEIISPPLSPSEKGEGGTEVDTKEYVHPTELCDLRFQNPPWGAIAPKEFLSYIATQHLAGASSYREGKNKATVNRAESWLKNARFDLKQWNLANGLWKDWQDEKDKRGKEPPSSAPPPIPDSEVVTGEAAKAAIAALKQKLSTTKETRHVSTEDDDLEF